MSYVTLPQYSRKQYWCVSAFYILYCILTGEASPLHQNLLTTFLVVALKTRVFTVTTNVQNTLQQRFLIPRITRRSCLPVCVWSTVWQPRLVSHFIHLRKRSRFMRLNVYHIACGGMHSRLRTKRPLFVECLLALPCLYYHLRMQPGNNVGRVCLSVCLSFETLDLDNSFLLCGCLSWSSSQVHMFLWLPYGIILNK